MKKLTVFLTLFLCVSFGKISAQTYTINWAANSNTSLHIKVNGVTVVQESIPSHTFNGVSGTLVVNEGDWIEVYGVSVGGLTPVITEDNPVMIENAMYPVEGDYYWYEYEHGYVAETFAIYSDMVAIMYSNHPY